MKNYRRYECKYQDCKKNERIKSLASYLGVSYPRHAKEKCEYLGKK